jgi:pimeloyl-ACP methyl ester carboxylesterase
MRGLNVVYPSDFPYFHGPLANMCPLEEAASRFVRDMASTAKGRGISRFWVAGHSNGGLIAMLAAEIAAREGFPEFPGMMRGVITMATPFRGTDAAILARPLVPVCRDISPGAGILDRIAQKKGLVRLCMLSGADFLVPFESQSLDGMKTVMMDGFQHMDFFVGTDEQVDRTAGNIKEAIDAG